MTWNGETIVDLSREFLASNGASKHQVDARRGAGGVRCIRLVATKARWHDAHERGRRPTSTCCSNKGLSERFDSTIGAGTVLMPFGGRKQLTPTQAMVAKLPVVRRDHDRSAMAWGFNPYIMSKNQFTPGAYLCGRRVAVCKLVGSTASYTRTAYLSFQEYFEKLRRRAGTLGQANGRSCLAR